MAKFYQSPDGQIAHLDEPDKLPERPFYGREEELWLCRAAFGIGPNGTFDTGMQPLHFRLEGPPGVGKNAIIYQVARELAKKEELPFYTIQGHEEMTPEDLSILVVPDPDRSGLSLKLKASKLATALYEGGLFFFDEINRVPERALTPLASVLDDRRELHSATTGITIRPKDGARDRFRFCCAMNPDAGQAGKRGLPDYIDERTLPVIAVDYYDLATLREILSRSVKTDPSRLDAFVNVIKEWYGTESLIEISVRQSLALFEYALRTLRDGEDFEEVLRMRAKAVLNADQQTKAAARPSPVRQSKFDAETGSEDSNS